MEDKKVSVVLPIIINHNWQKTMTESCIRMMRETTNVPYELIIVETYSHYFKSLADKYLHFPIRTSYTKDFNAGIDIASGNIIVHTANDIFVQTAWLESLLECFKIKDCGMSTLGSKELRHIKLDRIGESVSCPVLMAFKKMFKFDEKFPDVVSDTDLIMQYYEAGFRMYRNFNNQYSHLHEQTYSDFYTA